MSSITEIENAIEKLPDPQVEELVGWLEAFRAKKGTCSSVEHWLKNARGAASPGITTSQVMSLTRGEE